MNFEQNSPGHWLFIIMLVLSACAFLLLPVVLLYYSSLIEAFGIIEQRLPLGAWNISAERWAEISTNENRSKRSLYGFYLVISPILLGIALALYYFEEQKIPDLQTIIIAGVLLILSLGTMYLATVLRRKRAENSALMHITLYSGGVVTPSAIEIWEPLQSSSKTWMGALFLVYLKFANTDRALVGAELDREHKILRITFKPDENHSRNIELPFDNDSENIAASCYEKLLHICETQDYSFGGQIGKIDIGKKDVSWLLPIAILLVAAITLYSEWNSFWDKWKYNSAFDEASELYTAKKYEQSLAKYDEALQYTEDEEKKNDIAERKAENLAKLERYGEALSLVQPLLPSEQTSDALLHNASVYAYYANQYDSAYVYISKLLKKSNPVPQAETLYLAADIAFACQQYRSANEYYHSAIQSGLVSPQIYLHFGISLLHSGDTALARVQLSEARTKGTEIPDSLKLYTQ